MNHDISLADEELVKFILQCAEQTSNQNNVFETFTVSFADTLHDFRRNAKEFEFNIKEIYNNINELLAINKEAVYKDCFDETCLKNKVSHITLVTICFTLIAGKQISNNITLYYFVN